MESFRVTFVTGVTPDKWARIWAERSRRPLELLPVDEADQLDALRSGRVQMSFARLPLDRDGLHVIPLYREVPVVVVSKEHVLSVLEEIRTADLADELALDTTDLTLKQAVETVAAGTGYVVLPMSVARVHHRKDLVARPLVDGEESQIGLAWRIDDEDPSIEDFIGVVRGRTERSSRGAQQSPDTRTTSSRRRRPR